jgi:hypothetical protein
MLAALFDPNSGGGAFLLGAKRSRFLPRGMQAIAVYPQLYVRRINGTGVFQAGVEIVR